MIVGIGLDLIELSRIEKAIVRNDRFVQRILTPNERKQFDQLSGKRQIEFLAGRFAAKEAFAKAKGTGIGKLSWHQIEIESEDGRPSIASHSENEQVYVTITHTKEMAAAQVIITESRS